jgi:hypothetical protein
MMLTFSPTPPTAPGWYWRKSPSGDLSVIFMELHNGELASVTHTSRGAHPVTARSWYNQGWKLAGPVQPPKE